MHNQWNIHGTNHHVYLPVLSQKLSIATVNNAYHSLQVLTYHVFHCMIQIRNMCTKQMSHIWKLCQTLDMISVTSVSSYSWQIGMLLGSHINIHFLKFRMMDSYECNINHLIVMRYSSPRHTE